MIRKKSISSYVIDAILICFCTASVLPLITVISISLSNDVSIVHMGYSVLPRGFSLEAYRLVFETSSLGHSYIISIVVTLAGTLGAMVVNSMIAFAISRPEYKFRNAITFMVFFTMLFNGGMVANYILVARVLGLKNTLLALILPYMVSAWYILLLRTYMRSIPSSIFEAAEMDGATQRVIFTRIVLPLSTTALAAVGLFTALQYWNDWFLALMYTTKIEFAPLQYLLYKVTMNIESLAWYLSQGGTGISLQDMPAESTRMAVCMLAAGPILIAYPFFQRYFVKGITVGALKG